LRFEIICDLHFNSNLNLQQQPRGIDGVPKQSSILITPYG